MQVEHERSLGRYRLGPELGRGTLAAVYRATDTALGRAVAVKVLRADLPEEVRQGAREHFLREARAAVRLQHPNIATVYEAGEQGETAYAAMELLEGRSLESILRDADRLSFPRIGAIVAQLADALDHAHSLGIVHRDVRPANIFVTTAGEAKLADFGLAYAPTVKDGQPLTARSAAKYHSPQQALKQPLDASTDMFSLGVVLYEMLARRAPFELPDDSKLLALKVRIAREPHQPVTRIDPSIPAGFDRVLARALAKLPKDRYARACDMADALRAQGLAPMLGMPLALAPAPAAPAPAPTRPAARPPEPVPPAAAPSLPTAPAAQVQEAEAGTDLLGDLDAFSRTLDEQSQALARAAEEEKAAQEASRMAQLEAERRARETAQIPSIESVAPPQAGAAELSQSMVLAKLRQQSAARPGQAAERAPAKTRIDRLLRAAMKYLSELAVGVNGASPTLERPYELLYLPKPPPMSIAEAFTDLRTRRVGGEEVSDFVFLKFRAAYSAPARAEVAATDMELCKRLLDAGRVPFEVEVLKKNDFGQPTRVAYVLEGAIPCEIFLRANYDAGTVVVEMLNIGRLGKTAGTLSLEQLGESLLDEIGKFILGAPSEFAPLVLPGVRPVPRPAQAVAAPSALERLKRQGAARPGQTAGRSQAKPRIDRMLRAAMKYLSELAVGVNGASPTLERPYDLLWLPKPPPMSIAEAFTDLRTRRVEGEEVCDFAFLKFRAAYSTPARVEVAATDMELCKRLLDAGRVPFEVQVLKKNDFGQPTHVAYVLSGAIPCEIFLRANYDAGTVVVEMLNVGRFGKTAGTLTLEQLNESLLDEIGKFILGAPSAFAKLVKP